MLEFRYDTQLLIEGEDLDEDIISEYFTDNFKGDCLLAVGDEELIKIHFHTNEPWKVLEYCSTLGEIYDIVQRPSGLTDSEGHGRRHAFPRFRTYEYDLEIKSASLALIQKKDL